MSLTDMKSYGIFPLYLYVPILTVQKDKHDFIALKDGRLDLRYFLLRRKVAFDAGELFIYKQPVQSQSAFSVGEALDQLGLLTFFHDFNIGSLKYKDGNKVQLDYKVDWDLKLNRIKLYAKRNGTGLYPERIEIEGATKKDTIDDGRVNVVLNGGLGVEGTFTMKSGVIKTDLTLKRKGDVIAKIQPTLDIDHIDRGISIEKLDIISPFFQLAGSGHVSVDPVVATVKDDRFFLGLARKALNGVLT